MEVFDGQNVKMLFSKPCLRDLTVGSRIAFLRQFRRMSRSELGRMIGLSEENTNRIMSRYERAVVQPDGDKIRKIADILKVNVRMLSEYNMDKPEDLFYLMLWLEELCPNFTFTRTEATAPENMAQDYLSKHYYKWHDMRKRYRNNEISYEDYWEWKLK